MVCRVQRLKWIGISCGKEKKMNCKTFVTNALKSFFFFLYHNPTPSGKKTVTGVQMFWWVESNAEWLSSVNCIHYMQNFCGFDEDNDDDSAMKPLCETETKRGKMSLWRLSSTFVAW